MSLSSPSPLTHSLSSSFPQTFSGEFYDFHHGCDLVLVTAPAFAEGLGMDIHIRTTVR